RDAAFLDGSFSRLNFASRALPRAKTGSGAAANETGTDPSSEHRTSTARCRLTGLDALYKKLAKGSPPAAFARVKSVAGFFEGREVLW
ncbi:MAG: hypothetical protein KJ884_17160, partial [Gammaproteobacteria bacterium]|nr:hypothetical protein [Gammaproteobacteria bacterium]